LSRKTALASRKHRRARFVVGHNPFTRLVPLVKRRALFDLQVVHGDVIGREKHGFR
jgi:hypothetical protein